MIFSNSNSLKRAQCLDFEETLKGSKRIKEAARYQEAIQGLQLLLHGIDTITQQQPKRFMEEAFQSADSNSSSSYNSESEHSDHFDDEEKGDMETKNNEESQQELSNVKRTRMSVLDLIQDNEVNSSACSSLSAGNTSPVPSPSIASFSLMLTPPTPSLQLNKKSPSTESPISTKLALPSNFCYQNSTNSTPITSSPKLPSTIGHVGQEQNTIVFYYPCTAQKSYGSEKRFLCPPPVVSLNNCKRQNQSNVPSISVIVNVDNHELEHKATPDESNKASFKQIHVSSSSKLFQLKLHVDLEKNQTVSINSPPITIISKPSTKTTKSRNMSLAINSGDMVCLFNRVNSQTVRTKYMGIEKKKFVAKGSSWSPLVIKCASQKEPAVGTPITYGMEVVLIDTENGVTSEVMIVRKVVKNSLAESAVGSVTQLQKIALQPKSKPESFLSILPSCAYGVHNTLLCHHQPPSKSSLIQDYMCWTIVRIEKSECNLGSSQNLSFVPS